MTLPVVVVGLNHTRAPVEVRERLAVAESALQAVLADLAAATGLEEALFLATCNRVEVWGAARTAEAPTAVARWLTARSGAAAAELDGLLYVRRGLDAVAHMAAVAAGLDSMVVGEAQILGQVKAAQAAAFAHGALGPVLAEAVTHALRIARRVRTETEVGRGALSVGHAAVELTRTVFGDLRQRTVVLVGAGEVGALVARYLADLGVSRLSITSRTLERAEAVARQTGGKAVPFAEFPRHAAVADILICAATAPDVLIARGEVEAWVASRPRPLLIVDLGVPRNVERAVTRVADVYLYDIDDLQGVVESNRRAREREVERARVLIEGAVARLERSAAARLAAPTIRSLRAKLDAIRQAEVERAAGRLGDRSPEARAVLDALSVALVNKILHEPIEQLKAAQAAPGGARFRAFVHDLFGLDREDDRPREPEEGEEAP